MSKVKLYLDEDVFPLLSEILRERRYDVLSAKEAGMLGKSDKENLEFSIRDKRAILTFNISDYMKLAGDYEKHCGILFSPQRPLKEMLSRLLIFLASHTGEEVQDGIHWI